MSARPPATPNSRRIYDVAILGPDLAGAAAAALLSRKGVKVLCAPLPGGQGVREAFGFQFPTALPLLPPLRQLRGAASALDELGLSAELSRHAAPLHAGLQVLGPGMRLSLPHDPERRRSELWRELDGPEATRTELGLDALDKQGEPWDAALAEPPPWPPRGFFEKRKAAKLWPASPPPPPPGFLGEVLAALSPFVAPAEPTHAAETRRTAAATFKSPLRLWGGTAQLADLLRKKAQESGAEIRWETCEGLTLTRKGASFTVGGTEVTAAVLVAACGPDALLPLFGSAGKVERALLAELSPPSMRRMALVHFVLEPNALPLGLEEAALLRANSPLILCSLPARKPKGSAAERLLTVGALVPKGPVDDAALLSAVREALRPVLPFFERRIVRELVDTGSPALPRVLESALDGTPPGLRTESEVHGRVLHAGAAVYPGLGAEGAFLAGTAAAERAASLCGRKPS